MKPKFVTSLLVVSCVLFTVCSTASKEAKERLEITIAYTNDVLGEIEPCG
jgi:hypothetical protein